MTIACAPGVLAASAWRGRHARDRVRTASTPQSGHTGTASRVNSAERYGSTSASVATVERELFTGARRSTATPAATGSSASIGGRSSRSRNCRAYGLKLSTKRRWPSA